MYSLLHEQSKSILFRPFTKNLNQSTTSRHQYIKLLNNIAWENRFSKPDSTIYYAEKALELAKQENIIKEISKSLNYIGIAHSYMGNTIKSLQYYEQALSLLYKTPDSLEIAYTVLNQLTLKIQTVSVLLS